MTNRGVNGYQSFLCESGEIGKRTGLRIQLPFRDWGFKSPLSHQLSRLRKEFDEGRR
jgi:hypothetical protein